MHNFLICYTHNVQSGYFLSYERLLGYSSKVRFSNIINKETTPAISMPSVESECVPSLCC
jgi:hypothetical protein